MSMGTITIDGHTLELPVTEARALFAAVVTQSRRGGLTPISPDTLVAVTPSTRISLTVDGNYQDAYTTMLAEQDLGLPPSRRTGTVI